MTVLDELREQLNEIDRAEGSCTSAARSCFAPS